MAAASPVSDVSSPSVLSAPSPPAGHRRLEGASRGAAAPGKGGGGRRATRRRTAEARRHGAAEGRQARAGLGARRGRPGEKGLRCAQRQWDNTGEKRRRKRRRRAGRNEAEPRGPHWCLPAAADVPGACIAPRSASCGCMLKRTRRKGQCKREEEKKKEPGAVSFSAVLAFCRPLPPSSAHGAAPPPSLPPSLAAPPRSAGKVSRRPFSTMAAFVAADASVCGTSPSFSHPPSARAHARRRCSRQTSPTTAVQSAPGKRHRPFTTAAARTVGAAVRLRPRSRLLCFLTRRRPHSPFFSL